MLALAGIAVTSFLVGLSGAMMPGPMFAITVAHARRRGFVAGPLVVLGHGLLELVLVAVISLGFGTLLTYSPVQGTIGVVGGAALLVMGGSMVIGSRRTTLSFDNRDARKITSNPILGGILTSLSNPYWTLWWATVGLTYITLSQEYGIFGLIFFYIGHILSDLGWFSTVSAATNLGKRFVSDKVFQIVIAVCGIALFGFGIYFGYSGLRKLLSN
jgi:threonine/homoserine/homoserine lactone efflux protein